jgi:hypothetical protein
MQENDKYLRRNPRSSFIPAVFSCIVLLTCSGCQTCSLSKEDFQKQQNGQTVDRETGDTVAVVGTFGYYGAVFGEFLATVFGK